MPRILGRRRRRRRRRKRYNRRRGKKYKMDVTIVRGPKIIPDKCRMVLPYSETIQFTGTGNSIQVFRGNSLFDPDFTGVGHQPLGFDEWKAFYDIYKVHACSISIRMVNSSTLATVCAVWPSPYSTTPSLIDQALERPYTRSVILGTESGNSTAIMKNFSSTKSVWGQKIIEEDNFSSIQSANPVKEWYFLFMASQIAGSGSLNLSVVFKLKYYVEMFRRIPLLMS